ncbi:unnamed protein product, partial [Prorocentrum cordatum]
ASAEPRRRGHVGARARLAEAAAAPTASSGWARRATSAAPSSRLERRLAAGRAGGGARGLRPRGLRHCRSAPLRRRRRRRRRAGRRDALGALPGRPAQLPRAHEGGHLRRAGGAGRPAGAAAGRPGRRAGHRRGSPLPVRSGERDPGGPRVPRVVLRGGRVRLAQHGRRPAWPARRTAEDDSGPAGLLAGVPLCLPVLRSVHLGVSGGFDASSTGALAEGKLRELAGAAHHAVHELLSGACPVTGAVQQRCRCRHERRHVVSGVVPV